MNDRWLVSSFTASSLIHLALISVAALIMQAKPITPLTVTACGGHHDIEERAEILIE